MSRQFDFSRACKVCASRAALAVVALAAPGCVLFNPNPPLPKHGVVETAATPRAPDEFAQVVERAEVFYVPADRTGWALRQESGWKLIEALRRTGPFAIGWGAIGTEQQPMLDELPRGGSRSADALSRVTFVGAEPERERSRELLRQTTRVLGVSELALHCPGEIVEKLRRREPLTPEERAAFPVGFAASVGEHQPESEEPARILALSSRFIAENIVQRLGAHPGEKLLVFLDRAELENPNGVPFFVAQKSSVRQLVLESNQPESRARLLTGNKSGPAPRLLEIENRPPLS